MDTTTPKLPSSLSSANPDSSSRPTPAFQRVAPSTEPSSVDEKTSAIAEKAHSAVDATSDAGKNVMARVVGGLHGAVDSVASKVAPIVDRLKGTSKEAGDLPGQWTDAARTVIRERPIAAVSGALLVGAALLHFVSSSKR